jgi:hypothetical protein
MSNSLSTKSGVSNSDKSGIKPAICKTEILFRIWTGGTRHKKPANPDDARKEHSGVVAFLEDVVASRQGVLVPTDESMYVAVLENASQALVVARQVQLGMQDFQKKSGINPIAVSIALDADGSVPRTSEPNVVAKDSSERPSVPNVQASHDLLTLIRMSKPSQILLTHELFQKASLFRGLPLKTFQGRFGVFEYLWTAEEKLLELEGEQARFSDSEPSPAIQSERTELPLLPSRPATGEIGRSSFEPIPIEKSDVEAKPFWGSPLSIASALGLLLIVLIAGGIALRSRGSKVDVPTTQVIQSVTPASSGSLPKPKVSKPAAPHVSAPRSDDKRPTTSQPAHQKPDDSQKTASPVSTAGNAVPASASSKTCALQGNLDDYLRQAEYDRGRGDYTSAERLFSGVLDCDPNNERAKLGLTRTKAAQR